MTEIPHPRESTSLFGHEAAEGQFRTALASGRMHHAWLICGPKGIGKATLAYHAARLLLAPTGDERVLRRIMVGSHTDMLVLEPLVDEEKDETKREISVEQARTAGGFLSLTPAEGDWRVVIADSVDEMNANAANALLKVLEEPPPRSVLLLVSHNPGRLLPTIRSRCRSLKLPPLSNEAFHQALRLHAPDIDDAEVEKLAILSRFSPGMALTLHSHEGLELYADFVRLAGQGGSAMALADRIAGGQAHANWLILARLIARFFERACELGLRQADFAEIVPGEETACRALLATMPVHAIAELHARAAEQFSVAARLHLDYKTVLITFLQSMHRPQAA